ncbi:MAG TPA: hypothetical protein VMW79_06175 [Anaerolineae bacterium]|nr:hypothetical protein [Anaerolineae bacterium]HUW95979.1 hypothetical protein [Anaerolineae bacterium]
MKIVSVVTVGTILLLVMVSCGGGGGSDPNGWAKADREALTQDCIEYVIAEGDLSDSHASRYCRCWVRGMEAHYTVEYADTIINGAEMPDLEVLNIGIECLSE